jgi:hypothetical protein
LPVHLAVQCRLSHCTGLSFTGAPADDARNRQFDNPFVDCLLLPVNSTYPNQSSSTFPYNPVSFLAS